MTPKENNILTQAREVYKNRESDYYLETIRKTADELERTLTELEELKRYPTSEKAITHEEARNLLNELVPTDAITPSQIDDLHIYITDKKKEQRAKKVEELLGLMNELIELQNNYIKYQYQDFLHTTEMKELIALKKNEIKQLEEKMK